jgi:hypothetical protein
MKGRRAPDRLVAAIETDQAHLADASAAVRDLEVLQLRLCYRPVGVDDIEELGAILGRLRRGLSVARRWVSWVRNGESIRDGEGKEAARIIGGTGSFA